MIPAYMKVEQLINTDPITNYPVMEKNKKRDVIELNRADLYLKLRPNRFVHLKSEKPLDKRGE